MVENLTDIAKFTYFIDCKLYILYSQFSSAIYTVLQSFTKFFVFVTLIMKKTTQIFVGVFFGGWEGGGVP